MSSLFTINDLVFTPIFLVFIYFAFLFNLKSIKGKDRQKLFLQAVSIKIFSSIVFAFVYSYLYNGDTNGYWYHANIIREAFYDSPNLGFKLLLSNGEPDSDLIPYYSRMYWYTDRASFFVAKVASIPGILFFQTYTIIAICFSLFCFWGMWLLYQVFINVYPNHEKHIRLAMFFIPSLVFWGSGVMKDPLLIGGMGLFFYSFYFGLIVRVKIFKCILLFSISVMVLVLVKPFVLAAFLPSLLVCYTFLIVKRIKGIFLRVVMSMFLSVFISLFTYYFLGIISQYTHYDFRDLDMVAKQIEITSGWIHYVSNMESGSSYSLGDLDGTLIGTLSYLPKAIWVTLFRPYLWEAKNVTMFISAVESTGFFLITIWVLLRFGILKVFKIIFNDPYLLFCLIFSLFFAFVVGVSSFNFGTLVRYKIPMMPFYLLMILIVTQKGLMKKSNLAS